MDSLLVRLMILAALTQFSISLASFRDCTSGRRLARIEKALREVLRVDWRQKLRAALEFEGTKIVDFHVWRIALKAVVCELVVSSDKTRGLEYYR